MFPNLHLYAVNEHTDITSILGTIFESSIKPYFLQRIINYNQIVISRCIIMYTFCIVRWLY